MSRRLVPGLTRKETGDGQHWLRLLLGATLGAASLVMGGVKG
jgi:hypothetical protein